MKWWTILGLFALVAGCSQPATDTKADPCPGGGEEIVADGEALCVYDTRQSSIIETGFQCPAERGTRTDFGDLIVCSDGDPPMGLEEDLLEAYPDANLGGDSCANVLCETGETCVAGQCVADDPNNDNSMTCVSVPEVCDDGSDNDCDGAIDCADEDCASRDL